MIRETAAYTQCRIPQPRKISYSVLSSRKPVDKSCRGALHPMSSIGNTINTIDSSLLSEISSYQASQTSGSTQATPPASVASSDSINFSQVAQLFQQLQQLQTSNPTEFKQVLTDAATQFKTAAGQQTDPAAAGFLSNLSDQFQTAADTGNLSALQPAANGAHGGHHGHHHHHSEPASTADPSTTTNPDLITSLLSSTGTSSQTGQQIQQALTSLFS